MRRYIVGLQADCGVITVCTFASNWVAATKSVLDFECAPVSAVLFIEEYPL